jgi:predicted O-methyltransferase YrrM
MQFLDEKLENYITGHTQDEPELLRELNRETHLKVMRPRMISGHLQGRLLSLISKMLQPQYILEIGTYTGYSALCLAEGLQSGGELHTIDCNEELYEMQRKYFNRSPYAKNIYPHMGDALEIVPGLDYIFDLIFIDADKKEYLDYLEIVLPKMRPGSVLLSDNVLWSGKVLEDPGKSDEATTVLLTYNRRLKEDKKLETVVLPLRDGLAISRFR